MAVSKFIQAVKDEARGRPRSTQWYRDKIKEFGAPGAMDLLRDGKRNNKPFCKNVICPEGYNLSFEDSFKLSILTLTNTVSSALYGFNFLSFFDLNNFTKMSLILFMILGKIEIIAVIYLIRKLIFRE